MSILKLILLLVGPQHELMVMVLTDQLHSFAWAFNDSLWLKAGGQSVRGCRAGETRLLKGPSL